MPQPQPFLRGELHDLVWSCRLLGNSQLREVGMFKLVQHLYVLACSVELRDDRDGASLAEYALLLGLIVGVVAFTVTLLSGAIGDVFTAMIGVLSPADAGRQEG